MRAFLWSSLMLCCATIAVALAPHVARAQPRDVWASSRDEELRIALVTFGPGDLIPSYFGHDAMIVEDKRRHESHLYNFGMFSFGKGMLPHYLMGRLTFWVADTDPSATVDRYIAMNRSVHMQELNLPAGTRLQMAHDFATAVLPENREYQYDHYNDNCSLRLRDAIDRAVGGQFHRALTGPARLTYRGHTRRYAQRNPLLEFTLMFWMNDSMEQPLREWDELFLPLELERQVARVHYRDARGQSVALVADTRVLFEADRAPVPEWPAPHAAWALVWGGCAGLLLFATAWQLRRRPARIVRALFGVEHALIGLTLGLLGTTGFLMAAFTEHTVTYHNENLWLANPLTLLFWPLGVAIAVGRTAALRRARQLFSLLGVLALVLCGAKLTPTFDQDTSLPMAFILPLLLGGVCAHRALGLGAVQPPSERP